MSIFVLQSQLQVPSLQQDVQLRTLALQLSQSGCLGLQ
jgi:hypothetical protein